MPPGHLTDRVASEQTRGGGAGASHADRSLRGKGSRGQGGSADILGWECAWTSWAERHQREKVGGANYRGPGAFAGALALTGGERSLGEFEQKHDMI